MLPTKHSTTCVMDCPDTCALEVTVENDQIKNISGGFDHPNTDGFICSKISRFQQRFDYPERILYPMRRTGPKGAGFFVRISWQQAIDQIVDRFRHTVQQWGGEAILPYHYGGSNGILGDEFLDDYFFAKLGASRLAKTICAVPTTEVAKGMYGKMPGVAFEDFPKAECIIVWGANPKASNIHLVPYLRQAKKRNAFVAVVDPINRFSKNEIDLHLPVRPGTDLAVALAMIRYWHQSDLLDQQFLADFCDGTNTLLGKAEAWPLERAANIAGVSVADLERLADVYARSKPAVIRCGWGVERNRNGGQAVSAVLAMPALLGKFGLQGSGYTLSNNGGTKVDLEKILGIFEWSTRQLNMTLLGSHLNGDLKPPIKAIFVYNCNPVATVPDQNAIIAGLKRDDLFSVVFEQVMTDTALYADILLPASTFLEQYEIRKSYGSYVVGGVRPVVTARGLSKSNCEVFAELGRAMGWQDEPFTWDSLTCMRKVSEATFLNNRQADSELLISGKCDRFDFPGPAPVQMKTALPQTADGKIHLTPSVLGDEPYDFIDLIDGSFPLTLVSPANGKMISSSLGEFNYPLLRVEIHPQDARFRGISAGDSVRVFNRQGEVACAAKISKQVRQGVVSMPKGAWRKSSANRRTSTALCPTHVNKVGGGACFNDARVEIEKISRSK